MMFRFGERQVRNTKDEASTSQAQEATGGRRLLLLALLSMQHDKPKSMQLQDQAEPQV